MNEILKLTSDISIIERDALTLKLAQDLLSRGRQFTFVGKSHQAEKGTSNEFVEPFFVVQDRADIELMEWRIFSGRMYELPIDSALQGTIGSRVIKFQRRAIPETNRFPGEFSDAGMVNYAGTAFKEGRYRGTWKFACGAEEGELEDRGRFTMRRVLNAEAFVKALEESIQEYGRQEK